MANSLQRKPDISALIQAFDGFIYICSQDYRIQYMNDKLRKRTGYDATGEYCYKILHGCEDVCPWCKNDKLFREQKTIRWQLQSPKDERWYDIISTPIRNDDGSISKQSLIMDITEIYLAKEELSLLQTMINQSNDAIFVVDPETSAFIYVNEKGCSSLEALALIEQNPKAFDLLVTDMTMPHLTGFELAQKAMAIRSDLPVILSTGFSELLNKQQAQAIGIRAYLVKPVSVQELGLAVRKVLDARRELS